MAASIQRKKEDWPAQYPSVVVAVDDIKASVERSLASPWKFRATGSVSFFDTDGNRVSMMQPLEMRKGKAK
jgi:uncharacterized protein